MFPSSTLRMILAAAVLGAGTIPATVPAAISPFDFETTSQLSASPVVSGDLSNFAIQSEQAQTGSGSLRFDYTVADPFQSFTYDIPHAGMTAGTISVWFYDALGSDVGFNKYGGSIILENKNNPADFYAVEIWNGPYPAGDPASNKNYYLTQGNGSNAASFSSGYLGDRSIGWHQVVFTISATETTVSVDGISNANGSASPLKGPGAGTDASANLRLRFMAWSASNGGFGNWYANPTPQTALVPQTNYVYFDDLAITATAPAAASHTQGFEILSGTPEYDAAASFMVSSSYDNPYMSGFVPTFVATNAVAHGGTQSIAFSNAVPPFKSLDFDLATASPGELTLKFYDSLGNNTGFDKLGGAIMIEEVANPANFIALEIWNAPYPSGDPVKNYYLTKGTAGNPATSFSSGYFGDRSVGWQHVSIELLPGSSRIRVNGIENANGAGLRTGPGLNAGIRLRLLADSPSCGGFTNHVTATELNYLYLTKNATYVYYDNIVFPAAPASVGNSWMNYE